MITKWLERVGSPRPRIVLADDPDDRIRAAARRLESSGRIEAVVLSKPGALEGAAVNVPDQALEQVDAFLASQHVQENVGRSDPIVTGAALVAVGWADAVVAGATRTTASVLQTYLRILGPAPGATTVSSSMFICLQNGRNLLYSDCAFVPDPTSDQLRDITRSAAATYAQLTGAPPLVALLSFSTHSSANHRSVERVRKAVAALRESAPELAVDGELQFDAAFVPEVAARKAADSDVAGRANVFVFPNLDAGNIAYKITERLAGARVIGPLIQGLNGIAHDLSRGCSITDIEAVATVAALQASERP